MKAIGFVGTPRKESNTVLAVQAILDGAKERGAEIAICSSRDLNLKPCQACMGCAKAPTCVIEDDMLQIYDQLESADVLIFGSPVYMGQMTAQAKAFMDRLFAKLGPHIAPEIKDKFTGKKLIQVYTQGAPIPMAYQAYFDLTAGAFGHLGFDVIDTQVIAGMPDESTQERTDLINGLKKVGADLA